MSALISILMRSKEIITEPFIKRNYADTCNCSLWSCDLVGPMSCDQRMLIWIFANELKCTLLWITGQLRCVFNIAK